MVVKKLGLCLMAAVVLGGAICCTERRIIDCDAEPMIPKGLSIRPEDQIGSRITGQFEFDPTKIGFFRTDKQKESYEVGNDLKLALEGQRVLPANVLDNLLVHPEAIPESWKGKAIFFWGTIYYRSAGQLAVRCLVLDGDKWNWFDYWLELDFNGCFPAAVSAS